MTISFARHQFPPVIIRHAVWLYVRFTLSYRDVEDLLAERGLDVSYETVRRWVLKFGPMFAQELRRRRPRATSLSGGCADREAGHHAPGAVRSPFVRARRQSRHFDDEPLLSPDRRHVQKKTLVAREQDRADISRHRKRWRAYQGLIDPGRLVFIDETWTKTSATKRSFART
jgi:hypothetical protein